MLQVSLDLVKNCPNPEDPPYVMSGAFWIALAVRANTVARGVQLANQLRKQVDFPISFSFVRSVADRDPYVFGHWPKILTQNSKWVS
jgi:hypothetical protein